MLAVVLAGGENRRLPITKGLIEIGGKRLIETLLAALSGLFGDLAISTNEPEKYYYLGVPLIGDVYPVRGPMTGIFSALSFYSGRFGDAFFTACDMPFINMGLASRLAAMRIAPPKSRMNVRNRYELMFGAISVTMIFQLPRPLSF
ncbi:MAG: molybdenum cofactor guanylyltransferase, partial [Nitrospiraceae bacterium]|nr:molybdenum cofactor guanylyltransferase [Nitrospiraceae bacterium]